MRIVVKYRTKTSFKDKYTKEEVKKNDLLSISIERMKELNKNNAGVVEDIVVEEQELDNEQVETKVENTTNKEEKEQNTNEVNDKEETDKIRSNDR